MCKNSADDTANCKYSVFYPWRINAPFGYAIHWTSLFDGLLAAGAWPLTWMGFDACDALYIWGSAISPLLLMCFLSLCAQARVCGPGSKVRPSSGWSFFCSPSRSYRAPSPGPRRSSQPDPWSYEPCPACLDLRSAGWAYGQGRHKACCGFFGRHGGGSPALHQHPALLTILFISLVVSLAWGLFARNVLGQLMRLLTGVDAIFAHGCICQARHPSSWRRLCSCLDRNAAMPESCSSPRSC